MPFRLPLNLDMSVETKYCPDCKTVLPINKFTGRWRERSDGRRKVYDPRCSQCEYLRKKIKSLEVEDAPVTKSNAKQGQKHTVTHKGPRKGSAEHSFFCRLPCTT